MRGITLSYVGFLLRQISADIGKNVQIMINVLWSKHITDKAKARYFEKSEAP